MRRGGRLGCRVLLSPRASCSCHRSRCGGRIGNGSFSGQRGRISLPAGRGRRCAGRALRVHNAIHRCAQRTTRLHDQLGCVVQQGAAVRDERKTPTAAIPIALATSGALSRRFARSNGAARRSSGHTASATTWSSRGGITSLSGSASRVTGVNGVAGAAKGCASRASVHPCSSDCANSFARTCALVSTISSECGRRNVSSRSCASRILRISAFAASYRCAVHPHASSGWHSRCSPGR